MLCLVGGPTQSVYGTLPLVFQHHYRNMNPSNSQMEAESLMSSLATFICFPLGDHRSPSHQDRTGFSLTRHSNLVGFPLNSAILIHSTFPTSKVCFRYSSRRI